MAVSEMTVVAQIGTTIGLGLLFDTLVIRAFMTPSIAALLGRWFWWPLNTFRKSPKNDPDPDPERAFEMTQKRVVLLDTPAERE